jgi:hypothetical protein
MIRLFAYFCFLLLLFLQTGCDKEYSFEAGGVPPVRDTIRNPPPPAAHEFPVCPACVANVGTDLSEWSFKSGNSFLCGKADTAIITLERTSFTFFGPSSCSKDTGMVITVYLEGNSLTGDRTNITTTHNAFYYYDRVTPSYIFISQINSLFTVTITSYNHQARIATGTFHGNVLRANGNAASIDEGKFVVKLL